MCMHMHRTWMSKTPLISKHTQTLKFIRTTDELRLHLDSRTTTANRDQLAQLVHGVARDLDLKELIGLTQENHEMVELAQGEHHLKDEIAKDVEKSSGEAYARPGRADSAAEHEVAHHAPEPAGRGGWGRWSGSSAARAPGAASEAVAAHEEPFR